jgi:hypothetical protein
MAATLLSCEAGGFMEFKLSNFISRDLAADSLSRFNEPKPTAGFDSNLRKEVELLLECAKKKISSPKCQERIVKVSSAGG